MTTQGLALLKAEVAGTDSITFTKIVFSSDDYSQSADSTVQALTGLSSLDLTATARSFTDVNGNLKIRAVANNQNTTSAFYIKSYGLYGKNNAGNELLIAVSTTQNANFVPAYNGKQTNQIAYTFNIAISSTNNITISSPTDVPVTQADVTNVNSAVNSLANSAASGINSNASSLNSMYSTLSIGTSAISANSSAISSLQSSVASNATSIFTNEVNINNLQASVSTNSQGIADNSTAISKVSNTANQALNISYQGLRFMGPVPTSALYKCQQPGIYDLAGVKYDDWGLQLWGQFIVTSTGGVINQVIKNNVNNCWVQSCNGWGNTGFKQVY